MSRMTIEELEKKIDLNNILECDSLIQYDVEWVSIGYIKDLITQFKQDWLKQIEKDESLSVPTKWIKAERTRMMLGGEYGKKKEGK